MMRNGASSTAKDLTGKRYGKLVVIKRSEKKNKKNYAPICIFSKI